MFAPSLFIGAAAGMAFGTLANHLFGPAIGPPALYGVVAMGGVFAGAAQAPLTAIASVAEMTGNFTLTLPIMLACGIAAQLAKRITHGSIYTTKLLRRGIDIERPKALGALRALTVGEVMQPLGSLNGQVRLFEGAATGAPAAQESRWEQLVGPVTLRTPSPSAVRRGRPRAGTPPTRALRPRRTARRLPQTANCRDG